MDRRSCEGCGRVSRAELVAMARHDLALAANGEVELAPGIASVPTRHYVDPARFGAECDRIFLRVPLVLAFTAELAQPGAYKALDVAGTPVLIVRAADGVVRSFVNSCSHRGAQIVTEGTGSARRFSCPYHAWTYDQQGALVGILDRERFGEVDAGCHGLTSLTTEERAGCVFVSLDPRRRALDLDTFLCGYDDVLADLGLTSCRVVGTQTIAGPNWKIAYDGYLDLYHLPILHKDTFGTSIPNSATYFAWGPHQRVTSPVVKATDPLLTRQEDDWPIDRLTTGVWTIFPHVSIASFDAGGRVYLVSQLFPGAEVGTSTTVQTFLHTQAEAPGQAEKVAATMALLHHVVQDEDYATGLRQQRGLRTGAKEHVLFGRNEGGGQRFHRWVDGLLATDDGEVTRAFTSARFG